MIISKLRTLFLMRLVVSKLQVQLGCLEIYLEIPELFSSDIVIFTFWECTTLECSFGHQYGHICTEPCVHIIHDTQYTHTYLCYLIYNMRWKGDFTFTTVPKKWANEATGARRDPVSHPDFTRICVKSARGAPSPHCLLRPLSHFLFSPHCRLQFLCYFTKLYNYAKLCQKPWKHV